MLIITAADYQQVFGLDVVKDGKVLLVWGGEAAFCSGKARTKALICEANQWIGRFAPNRGFAARTTPYKEYPLPHELRKLTFPKEATVLNRTTNYY